MDSVFSPHFMGNLDAVKFRGVNREQNKWVYGQLVVVDGPLYCLQSDYDAAGDETRTFIQTTGFADWGMPRSPEFEEVIPGSVGQYVGAKVGDVELYTGMICNLTDYHGRRENVTIHGPIAGCFYYGGDGFSDEYLINAAQIEVVGIGGLKGVNVDDKIV
ncbi:MAG: hypothetical protein RR415_12655 [Ruthenibacterium sp.]